MLGFLKKKLKKVVDSVSEKLKEKGDTAKKIEETLEDKVDEITEVLEEPEKIVEVIEKIEQPKVKEELKKELEPVIEELKKKKPEERPKRKSLFKKVVDRVTKKIVERRLSESDLIPVLNELETDLIEADVAIEVVEIIKADLLKDLLGKEIKRGREREEIISALKKSLIDILSVPEVDLEKMLVEKKEVPLTLMFLGFNGSGKTTSLAKLAKWLMDRGHSCVFAAADSWRAAAIEQLEEHANKISVNVIKHKYGADPAAIVYDAIAHARARGVDFVLADTAGRIHTNKDLMQEMEKIIRVNKPDLKILVIDSMTGNDAVLQAREFGGVGVDAVIFTKVDVNEKGGAILSVTNELKKPILFLGIGQRYTDFEKFDAEKFVNNLLSG